VLTIICTFANLASMNTLDVAANAQQAADLLRTLSNPGRLMILCLLSGGEKTVGELERAVGPSQSQVMSARIPLRVGSSSSR